MDNRKLLLSGILILIMILTVLTALVAPGFAENAVSDSPAAVPSDQSGNENVKTDAAEGSSEKSESPAEDASAELEKIYQRISEIKSEFDKTYESYSDEIETLMEQTEKLMKKAGQYDRDCCEREPWDRFAEDRERPWEMWPGGDQSRERLEPDRKQDDHDSPDAPENPNRPDSDKDRTPPWDEIMRLLETIRGNTAQHHNEEAESTEQAGRKPYVGLTVSTLTDEEKAVTGIQAGVLVHQVEENAPAAKAGIRAYDVIVGVNGTEVASSDELAAIVAKSAPGDILRFRLYRQGTELEYEVIPAD